jgi:hypothetical protein
MSKSRDKSDVLKPQDNELPETHLKSIWQNLSPAERLRRSWAMRRLLKDKRLVHDKKLFPHP